MVFSDDGGEGHFFSLFASEKLSAMRGILLMVLYLLRLESEVEPSRLDLIWLSGPGRKGETVNTLVRASTGFSPLLIQIVDIGRTTSCPVVTWVVNMARPDLWSEFNHRTTRQIPRHERRV